MFRRIVFGGLAIGFMAGSALAVQPLVPILTENFNSDPVAGGRAVIQSNDGAAGSRFVTAGGTMTAAYDTSRQSAKMVFPLGRTLTDADTFAFTTTLQILDDGSYAPDSTGGLAQISFGLVNAVTTGLNRTGDLSDFTSDTFDMVTVDYFPNTNPFFDALSIVPTEFDSGSGDAFAGIHSPFGSESVIDESGEVGELALDTPYAFRLDYDGATRLMTVTLGGLNINQVGQGGAGGPDSDVTTIQQTLPGGPGGANFAVDSFALLLWNDGYNQVFSANTSLIADVRFDQFTVFAVPEPASLAVVVVPMIVLLSRRRRGA